ncbi:DUF4177 domain-containing protein [Paracoccus sp. MBLB3053]|uniref:DUF4177 domain-containing protein n=1 Tax=Paracoccus aurantius TaxID=3073814 RepID=A0ABU2HR80_9RHOB|nr:DUF4177 domain-containing protein [Paracoccus sp. MBLB3053]MDS9467553.1 DUF4177 domain-containing protein [Paracoccus sp. MBLB3053]
MSSYEYTVIPAPSRGEKTKGAKTGIERFAATLTVALNDMALDGWEYVRAETLPAEERAGLTGRTTVYHNILIFRRKIVSDEPEEPIAAPVPTPTPAAAPAPSAAESTAPAPAVPTQHVSEQLSAVDLPADNQVRAPFSQPMRAMPRPVPSRNVERSAEPPLTAPELPTPAGPRLGPANR